MICSDYFLLEKRLLLELVGTLGPPTFRVWDNLKVSWIRMLVTAPQLDIWNFWENTLLKRELYQSVLPQASPLPEKQNNRLLHIAQQAAHSLSASLPTLWVAYNPIPNPLNAVPPKTKVSSALIPHLCASLNPQILKFNSEISLLNFVITWFLNKLSRKNFEHFHAFNALEKYYYRKFHLRYNIFQKKFVVYWTSKAIHIFHEVLKTLCTKICTLSW